MSSRKSDKDPNRNPKAPKHKARSSRNPQSAPQSGEPSVSRTVARPAARDTWIGPDNVQPNAASTQQSSVFSFMDNIDDSTNSTALGSLYKPIASTQTAYGYSPYSQSSYSKDRYGLDPNSPNPYSQNPYSQNPYSQNPYSQDPHSQNPYMQNAYAQYTKPFEPSFVTGGHLSNLVGYPDQPQDPSSNQYKGLHKYEPNSKDHASSSNQDFGETQSRPLLHQPQALEGPKSRKRQSEWIEDFAQSEEPNQLAAEEGSRPVARAPRPRAAARPRMHLIQDVSKRVDSLFNPNDWPWICCGCGTRIEEGDTCTNPACARRDKDKNTGHKVCSITRTEVPEKQRCLWEGVNLEE